MAGFFVWILIGEKLIYNMLGTGVVKNEGEQRAAGWCDAVTGSLESRPGAERRKEEYAAYGCPRYRTFPIHPDNIRMDREEELDAA
jgi:hypothetical protein